MIANRIPALLMHGTGVIDTQKTLTQAVALARLAKKAGVISGSFPETEATLYALEIMLKHVSNDTLPKD